jgi:predicted amidohydrolase
MRVAAVQMDLAWERVDDNLQRAAALFARAAERGAELVTVPEMFATGFSMNAEAVAEDDGGPIETFLSDQAREHGFHLLGTKARRTAGGRPVNAALLFGPDGALLSTQHKIHPFTLAGEQNHFDAGDELAVTTVGGLELATAICYDLRFPELFRALAFRGATLIVVPANWPIPRVAAWSHLLISRAIENQCYVVGVNRVGHGAGLDYDGCSAIVDPLGEVLASGRVTEQILVADLDPDRVTRVREELPFLGDARKDLFGDLWGR